MMRYLGIDIGTSFVKAIVASEEGGLLHYASSVPGASKALETGQIDPDAWVHATIDALRGLAAKVDLSCVECLSVIGNTPTLICVDKDGKPLYPALLWSDTRAVEEAEELLRERSQDEWNELYGMFMPVSAAYPSAKLRWLMKHEAPVIKQTAYILQPKDYINFKLTGVFAADRWTSKGLASLDPMKGNAPLKAVGLDESLVPICYRPIDIIGQVSAKFAIECGIRDSVLVTAGWSDTLGGVLSLGLSEEDAFVLSGTSESIGMMVQSVSASSNKVFVAPVWDTGYYVVYGPTSSGLSTVTWAAKTLGFSDIADFKSSIRESTPIFVPYILGQRSPIWDDSVRGMWVGVDINTTKEDLMLAVLEGITSAEKDVLLAASEVAAKQYSKVVVSGGGTFSKQLNEFRASMLNVPVYVASADSALGAAFLAYWGLGRNTFPLIESVMLPTWRLECDLAASGNRYELYKAARRVVLEFYRNQKKI